jgi:signal transduction histidine kinase
VLLYYLRSPERPLDYVTFYLVLLACWSGGAWIRARQAGEAERSRKEADVAIERERAHIARELHDVVTHHVTAMVVQADAAGYLLPGSPDRVTESLAAIGGTGRQALTELRQLLGVLDASGAGGAPANAEQAPPAAPGLLLSELVTRTKQAGQPVYLAEDGAPTTVAADVGLAAYRVVQEGLTNAVKHAPGRHTAVRVRYGKELEVEVTTDGPVITAGDFTPGRGLSGLQDRVRACGGTLMAGGKPGGGFTVLARIPSEAAT